MLKDKFRTPEPTHCTFPHTFKVTLQSQDLLENYGNIPQTFQIMDFAVILAMGERPRDEREEDTGDRTTLKGPCDCHRESCHE